MMMIKLRLRVNAAQVTGMIKKRLQNIIMHEPERSLPPTGARRRMELRMEYQDWARLQGRGV
jgi:hypothetical protein